MPHRQLTPRMHSVFQANKSLFGAKAECRLTVNQWILVRIKMEWEMTFWAMKLLPKCEEEEKVMFSIGA